MYCEKCCRVFKGYASLCPVCSSRKLREPRMDDPCFLTEKEAPWGEMLADVLTQRGITYLQKPVLGAGVALKLGQGMERYRFYVLFEQLFAAREVLEELFPSQKETK